MSLANNLSLLDIEFEYLSRPIIEDLNSSQLEQRSILDISFSQCNLSDENYMVEIGKTSTLSTTSVQSMNLE